MAYLISEVKPTKGFHPISTTAVHLPRPSSLYRSCSLHLYYTLPPLVFVDTHELTERSSRYTFTQWGNRDVEKPVNALPDVVSEVLLNVPIPAQEEWDNDEGEVISVELPMHLRYGSPRSTRSKKDTGDEKEKVAPYEEVRVDWPKAFFLCPSSTSLRAQTSLDTLPPHVVVALPSGQPQTRILIPISPHSNYSQTFSTLLLPVGDTSDLAFVEPLTAFTILVCFLWLFKASWRTAKRLRADLQREKAA